MRKSKSLRTLQFCWSYAELAAAAHDLKADEGLIGYHAYFNGSIDVLYPAATLNELHDMYKNMTTREKLIDDLSTFASITMMTNIADMCSRLASEIKMRVKCLASTDSVTTYAFNNDLLTQIKNAVAQPRATNGSFIFSQQRDTIDALVGAIICDATVATNAKELSSLSDVDISGYEAIATLADYWANAVAAQFCFGVKSSGANRINIVRTIEILKALIALTAVMNTESFDEVRFGRLELLGSPFTEAFTRYGVSDKTLIALPRPTKFLLDLCGYNGCKPSQNGLLYMATYSLMVAAD